MAGRPNIEIDQKIFENLCYLQCTLGEIAKVFSCSEDTIQRWVQKTYDTNFASIYDQKGGEGKIALRRMQFRLAEKNVSMAIWLGKQWLNQSDERMGTSATKINIVNDVPKGEDDK
jgi:AraC-like DNA-binding protein